AFNELVEISPKLRYDPETDYESWIKDNMPHGPRWGMYQSAVGDMKIAWRLRERLYYYFHNLHYDTDTKQPLFTSIDGASIYPPKSKYLYRDEMVGRNSTKLYDSSTDWAHIDTMGDEKIYQGQIILTDTDAAFRCTPYSHKIHNKICK